MAFSKAAAEAVKTTVKKEAVSTGRKFNAAPYPLANDFNPGVRFGDGPSTMSTDKIDACVNHTAELDQAAMDSLALLERDDWKRAARIMYNVENNRPLGKGLEGQPEVTEYEASHFLPEGCEDEALIIWRDLAVANSRKL